MEYQYNKIYTDVVFSRLNLKNGIIDTLKLNRGKFKEPQESEYKPTDTFIAMYPKNNAEFTMLNSVYKLTLISANAE